MLKKEKRLGTKLFPAVVGRGRMFQGRFFSLKVLNAQAEMKEKSKSHFSVVISKKVAPLAVTRNLIKRRGLAVIKPYLPEIEKKAGKNVIFGAFFAKKGVEKASFQEIKSDLAELVSSSLIH